MDFNDPIMIIIALVIYMIGVYIMIYTTPAIFRPATQVMIYRALGFVTILMLMGAGYALYRTGGMPLCSSPSISSLYSDLPSSALP